MNCSLDYCDREVYGKGYCSAHYQQWRTNGILKPIRQFRAGTKCSYAGCNRAELSLGLCQTHYKMQLRREPLRPIGKKAKIGSEPCSVPGCDQRSTGDLVCSSHYSLVSKFNLSKDMIENLFADPKCEICGATDSGKRSFHVDHDHNCCGPNRGCDNCVRGLLCSRCNQGLGLFRDNPHILNKASKYLSEATRYEF